MAPSYALTRVCSTAAVLLAGHLHGNDSPAPFLNFSAARALRGSAGKENPEENRRIVEALKDELRRLGKAYNAEAGFLGEDQNDSSDESEDDAWNRTSKGSELDNNLAGKSSGWKHVLRQVEYHITEWNLTDVKHVTSVVQRLDDERESYHQKANEFREEARREGQALEALEYGWPSSEAFIKAFNNSASDHRGHAEGMSAALRVMQRNVKNFPYYSDALLTAIDSYSNAPFPKGFADNVAAETAGTSSSLATAAAVPEGQHTGGSEDVSSGGEAQESVFGKALHSLADLQKGTPDGVDPLKKEEHLGAADFRLLLEDEGVKAEEKEIKEKWEGLMAWKRKSMKQKKGIF